MTVRRTSILLAAMLLLPSSAAAQLKDGWEIIPQVGWYLPVTDLGPVAAASDILYLESGEGRPALSLGLSLRTPFSPRGLSLTLRGLVALPTVDGVVLDCFSGVVCLDILRTAELESVAWLGGIDLMYRPSFHGGVLRPFALLGGGVKQSRYAWSAPEVWGVTSGEQGDTRGTLHFGIGFDLDLTPVPLRVELADYWTAGGRALPGPGDGVGVSPPRPSQHEFSVTLGWRIPLS